MINLSILKGRLAESFVAGNKKIKFDIMISLINFFWISLKFHKCATLRQQIFAAFQFRGFLGQYWILWYYDFAIQSKYFISHFLNSTAVLKTEFFMWVSFQPFRNFGNNKWNKRKLKYILYCFLQYIAFYKYILQKC